MGCTAEIKAIGKFHKNVLPCLPYPADCYKNMEEGDMVLAWVCCMRTSESSRILAECFNVKLWDFTTHIIEWDKIMVDFALLEETIETSGSCPEIGIENTVSILVRHDFTFIFQPNG